METSSALAVLAAYYGVLLLLAVYALHRFHLVHIRRGMTEAKQVPAGNWPAITIQLPIYNEPAVAGRVIETAACLEYPGPLDIQVLDDSTDSTTFVIAPLIDSIRRRGVSISHIRRGSRDGFKAGALAYGMTRSSADLFAVFDADFVPPPDTLVRMVPSFSDRSIGMVQARWGHLNRDESLLTRAQAIFLDAHFAVESAARFGSGVFFNFNGTAGIWKREAIADAGGWSAATLTEDLDLSYRAQLAGWRFVFLGDVVVPGELPPSMGAFQEQQFRWAKGSAQTARRLLGSIMRAPIPAATRLEAVFHLTGNFTYVLTICLALLMVPAMEARRQILHPLSYLIDAVLFLVGTCGVFVFYLEGQRRAGRPRPRWRALILLLPIGIAVAARNCSAVIEGLIVRGGEFRRTPKRGDMASLPDHNVPWPVSELCLTIYFALGHVTAVVESQYLRLPFLSFFLIGFAYATTRLVVERLGIRRRAREGFDRQPLIRLRHLLPASGEKDLGG